MNPDGHAAGHLDLVVRVGPGAGAVHLHQRAPIEAAHQSALRVVERAHLGVVVRGDVGRVSVLGESRGGAGHQEEARQGASRRKSNHDRAESPRSVGCAPVRSKMRGGPPGSRPQHRTYRSEETDSTMLRGDFRRLAPDPRATSRIGTDRPHPRTPWPTPRRIASGSWVRPVSTGPIQRRERGSAAMPAANQPAAIVPRLGWPPSRGPGPGRVPSGTNICPSPPTPWTAEGRPPTVPPTMSSQIHFPYMTWAQTQSMRSAYPLSQSGMPPPDPGWLGPLDPVGPSRSRGRWSGVGPGTPITWTRR